MSAVYHWKTGPVFATIFIRIKFIKIEDGLGAAPTYRDGFFISTYFWKNFIMYQTLLTSIENNVLTITINRPEKLNALNGNVLQILIKY